MKPKYTKELIPLHYWTCPIPEHRHASEGPAIKCAIRQDRKNLAVVKTANNWREYYNLKRVLKQHCDGHTLNEIGTYWGVSPERARQIIAKARRVQRMFAAIPPETE